MKNIFYKTSDVAEMVGVSIRQVRRYCEEGIFLGAYKTGTKKRSRWRIPKASVDQYLKLIGK